MRTRGGGLLAYPAGTTRAQRTLLGWQLDPAQPVVLPLRVAEPGPQPQQQDADGDGYGRDSEVGPAERGDDGRQQAAGRQLGHGGDGDGAFEAVCGWPAGARCQAAGGERAAGGRVDPVGIWISAPRPSPVMVWTPAQAAVFLKAAGRHRLHAFWRLIATRGLRRGEGCGLRRSDTDLSAWTTC